MAIYPADSRCRAAASLLALSVLSSPAGAAGGQASSSESKDQTQPAVISARASATRSASPQVARKPSGPGAGENGPAVVDPIPEVGDLAVIRAGNGRMRAILFADPRCSYCARLLEQLPLPDSGMAVDVVLYPILGEDSLAIARQLECVRQTDQNRAFAILQSKNWSQLDSHSDCAMDALDRSLARGEAIGASTVPFVIAPNGAVSRVVVDLATFITKNLN